MNYFSSSPLFVVAAALALAACSQSAPPAAPAPAAQPVAAPAPPAINAPAGEYRSDLNHSSLNFTVNHLGLSNYRARFTAFQVTLQLDPANLAASSVSVTIDPASVRTDYAGDYRAGHKTSAFSSWDEDLAKSDKFFNSAAHPQITFRSTHVEPASGGMAKIHGDLTLLGQTHPLTLEAKVVGSVAKHPFTGAGALGFSASGSFLRSSFGMNHLLNPPLVGDRVTIEFEGEFHQVVAPAVPAAG